MEQESQKPYTARAVLTDRTFWRDLGTLAGLVLGGVSLAALLWFSVLAFWAVAD